MSLSKGAKIIIFAGLSLIVCGTGFIGIFLINNVVFRGEIVYLDFEGGFYGIIGNNEEAYEPINLPVEFQEEGLEVFVIAKLRRDLGSYHIWGKSIIEIRSIRVLNNN